MLLTKIKTTEASNYRLVGLDGNEFFFRTVTQKNKELNERLAVTKNEKTIEAIHNTIDLNEKLLLCFAECIRRCKENIAFREENKDDKAKMDKFYKEQDIEEENKNKEISIMKDEVDKIFNGIPGERPNIAELSKTVRSLEILSKEKILLKDLIKSENPIDFLELAKGEFNKPKIDLIAIYVLFKEAAKCIFNQQEKTYEFKDAIKDILNKLEYYLDLETPIPSNPENFIFLNEGLIDIFDEKTRSKMRNHRKGTFLWVIFKTVMFILMIVGVIYFIRPELFRKKK